MGETEGALPRIRIALRRSSRPLLVVLLSSLWAARAHAQTAAHAQTEARLLSASPDSAVVGIAQREELRGKVGVTIPIVLPEDGEGWWLQLPALIELHNARPSFVPYQLWRGRVSLELGHRFTFGDGLALSVSGAAEHESDHSSLSTFPGFVNLNGVAARADVTFGAGPGFLTASVVPRLHLLTCTHDPLACGAGGGKSGSVAFEQSAELVWDASPGWAIGPARPFVSLAGTWLFAHREAVEEIRLTGDLGLALRAPRRGLFQIYATSLVGHDVGYVRQRGDAAQAGIGLRWAP